jgi:hypothetical protein
MAVFMSDHPIQDETVLLKHSALSMFVGECIGSGSFRRVYEVKHDPTIVLKIEYAGVDFCNHMEWRIWNDVKNWPIADWFVPCVAIDCWGNALFQKKTQPFSSDQEFKAALTRTRGGVIPAALDDVHFGNFGLYNDIVACHDYGFHNFFEKTAREMSVEAGYIKYDDPDKPAFEKYDFTDGGQFALDI